MENIKNTVKVRSVYFLAGTIAGTAALGGYMYFKTDKALYQAAEKMER